MNLGAPGGSASQSVRICASAGASPAASAAQKSAVSEKVKAILGHLAQTGVDQHGDHFAAFLGADAQRRQNLRGGLLVRMHPYLARTAPYNWRRVRR